MFHPTIRGINNCRWKWKTIVFPHCRQFIPISIIRRFICFLFLFYHRTQWWADFMQFQSPDKCADRSTDFVKWNIINQFRLIYFGANGSFFSELTVVSYDIFQMKQPTENNRTHTCSCKREKSRDRRLHIFTHTHACVQTIFPCSCLPNPMETKVFFVPYVAQLTK